MSDQTYTSNLNKNKAYWKIRLIINSAVTQVRVPVFIKAIRLSLLMAVRRPLFFSCCALLAFNNVKASSVLMAHYFLLILYEINYSLYWTESHGLCYIINPFRFLFNVNCGPAALSALPLNMIIVKMCACATAHYTKH